MEVCHEMKILLQLLLLFVGVSAEAATRSNVLFILADDLGWSDTTLYGQTKFYETPNIERLARRGMVFTRAYTASPLCSPTRSSILTGLHPARTGITSPNCHTPKVVLQATNGDSAPKNRKLLPYSSVTRLDTRYHTLSGTLREAGYVTGHFGKWHLGAEPYSPLQHGFDVDVPHWHGPGPAGSFVAPWKFPHFKEKYPGEHLEDRMGDEAVAFMEANKDKPFFLNYWQFSVHAPFDAKAAYVERHRKRADPRDAQRSPTYAAMVQSLDENVGKMLDALDRLGLSENTIVIFFSDNGGNMYNTVDGTTPTSNRPLRGGKGNNWDGGTRVPAVVVWPGEVRPGSRSDTRITSTDFYPTLLEMLGLNQRDGQIFDGLSIVPALRGRALERDAIFSFFPHSTRVPDSLPPSVAMHSGDWKLIRLFHDNEDRSHRHLLFKVTADIGERDDQASREPELVAALGVKLDAFLQRTRAVTPQPNPAYDSNTGRTSGMGVKPIKNCELMAREGRLSITATGADPHFQLALPKGFASDGLRLQFRWRTESKGAAQLYWTEKGREYDRARRVEFQSPADGREHAVEIAIPAKAAVTSLRLDPFPGRGKAVMSSARLVDGDGRVLHRWEFR